MRMFFGAVDYQPLQAGLDDGSWGWRPQRPEPTLFRLSGPGKPRKKQQLGSLPVRQMCLAGSGQSSLSS